MKTLKPIIVYVILAYLISWLVFVPLALNHYQIIYFFRDDTAHTHTQDVWHLFGAFGPFVAAVATIKRFYNKETQWKFISGYSIRKLNAKSYMLSLSPLFIFAFSLVMARIIHHDWFNIYGYFQHNKLNNPANLLAWFLPALFYGFGEEAGWRGYALAALQSKYSAFRATIILSGIWACWHIPSFFYRYDLKGIAYLGFVLGIVAGAIWLTFLFNYTKGSILAVSLWHLTFNMVSMIGKDEIILSAIMSITIMLLAAFVLIKYKFEDLSPCKKEQINGGNYKVECANDPCYNT